MSGIEKLEGARKPFAATLLTLRQRFANVSPTLCQPFLPTPLQAPLSVGPNHLCRNAGQFGDVFSGCIV